MVDKDDYDLIDLHPDFRLSSTSRRIPFVNFTDSVRISMGTSMLKQSIQLINAERPLVDTGNNEELSSNVIADKYQGTEGEVTDVTSTEVVIKDNDGKVYKIPKRSYIPSLNQISVYSEAKVKVGDKVKNGDVIVGGVTIEKDTVKTGINANVLFHAYHGLINEDAIVVSESFADKMAHYSIVDLSINIKTNTALNWIAPIGTVVKFKEPIVKCKKTAVLNEVNKIIKDKLGELINYSIDDYTEPYDLIVPNNIEQAVVADVKIMKNNPIIPKNVKSPDYTYAETSEEVSNEYFKRYDKDRKVIVDNYPEYISDDVLKDFEIDRYEYKLVYVVKVRLIVYNRLKIADLIWSEYTETYNIEQCELLESPEFIRHLSGQSAA
jgi:RNase P/RNase MRP subunit p29